MADISVAVVEDHDEYRNSLRLIIGTSAGLSCFGAFGSCEALLEELEVEDDAPHVVLMDIGLPGMSGVAGVERLKAITPQTKVIMFTIYEDDANVFRAICAGASGYLLKKTSPVDIVRAIENVAAGDVPMTPSVASQVMEMFRDFAPKPEICDALTPRELEVLQGLVDGLQYKEIAQRHFISLDTVRIHIRHVYEKLHVHSKSEAVAKALKQRLV